MQGIALTALSASLAACHCLQRLEPLGVPGSCVGYQIRGEKRAHPGTNLLFTTTGVLLRRLVSGLGHVTHIVVDEVHERNVDTDFLLAVLKRVLPARRDVKVVMMSATMNAEAFAAYFADVAVSVASGSASGGSAGGSGGRGGRGGGRGGVTRGPGPAAGAAASGGATGASVPAGAVTEGPVPIIAVPGFTHPVREVYLEELMAASGYEPLSRVLKGTPGSGKAAGGAATPSAAGAAIAAAEGEGGRPDAPTGDLDDEDDERTPTPARRGTGSAAVDPHKWLKQGLDYACAASALHHICAPGNTAARCGPGVAPPPVGSADDALGSVLVFLPGVPEIRRLHRELERTGSVGHLHILHLHGALSSEEQGLVFQRPPRGKRKVVLATNVAETSITIDDVTVVVDTLRVKEARYDHLNGTGRLEETWVSKAAAKQRRGRAGRVRPGVCYRLAPSASFDLLAPQTVPEIQRTPLATLCLQVKLLQLGAIRSFMASVLDAPSASAVSAALDELVGIGALVETRGGGAGSATGGAGTSAASGTTGGDYALTPLGHHLAMLPLDVHLGKALLMGAILRCVDPLLTIVAALAERSPFRPLPPMMDEAEKAAITEARAKLQWAESDHLAIVKAFNGWRAAGNQTNQRKYADAHGLSHETLRTMAEQRTELAGILADLGFLRKARAAAEGEEAHGEYDDGGDDPTAAGAAAAGWRGGGGRGGGRGGGGPPGRAGGGGGGGRNPDGRFGELSAAANTHATVANVIRAALTAGLYPKVVKVVSPPRRYGETSTGAVPLPYKSSELRLYTLESAAPPGTDGGSTATGSRYGGGSTRTGKSGGGSSRGTGGKLSTAKAEEVDSDFDSSSDDDEDGDEYEAEDKVEAPKATGSAPRVVMQWKGFAQERVFLHPGSFNFSTGEYPCPWLVYYEKAATNKVYIRECSAVTPYAMMLFGGAVTVLPRENKVCVGERRWVSFQAEARIGVLVKGLRAALTTLLAAKVANPHADISGHKAVEAIVRLVVGNGM